MKILAFGDVHFVNSPGAIQGMPEHLYDAIETCKWVARMVTQHRPEVVINLGDTNETHGYIDLPTLQAMCEGVRVIDDACKAVGAEHSLMLGNHDQYSWDGKISIGCMFPKTHVVQDVDTLPFGPPRVCNYAMISFAKTYDMFMERLAKVPVYVKYLFIHQDIVGAMRFKGSFQDSGIDPNTFARFKRVFVGHFHHPYQLMNITFVGSASYHTWHDNVLEDPRGCIILDTQTDQFERIENPVTSMYHTVKIENEEQLNALLQESLDPAFKRWCMRVVMKQSLITSMEGLKSRLAENYRKLQIVPVSSDVEVAPGQVTIDMNSDAVIDSVVDEAKNPPIDRAVLKRVGKDLIKECMS